MGQTSFMVSCSKKGQKLRSACFSSERQARKHAAYMAKDFDCVVLTKVESEASMSAARSVPPVLARRA